MQMLRRENALKQDAEEEIRSENYAGQSVSVTRDGGVTKTLLTGGSDAKDSPVSSDSVKYTGKLEDGSAFDSSCNREGGFLFQLGKGMVFEG